MTNPALSAVRALLFDVFGTVVDWRSGVARDVSAFAATIGRPEIDAFAFADAWRALYSPAMEEVRSGRRGFVRLDVLHRESLLAVLADHGIDLQAVSGADLDHLNHAWHRLDPWPDAVAGLERLRQRFIVAPLSNGNIALLLDMAKRAGLAWDAILGAEVVRAYKPMPEAYLGTADVLGLAPDALCLVAAHNSDLAAARTCGLRTAYVARPDEFAPDRPTGHGATDAWDVIATDFHDLADQICA